MRGLRRLLVVVLALVLSVSVFPLTAASAAAGENEIVFNLTYADDGEWVFSNVDVGAAPTGYSGYKVVNLSYPSQLEFNYVAPAGWVFTQSAGTGGSTSIHVTITNQNTQGTPAQIKDFFSATTSYLTLATPGVFPTNGATVDAELDVKDIARFTDAEGGTHYYEYIQSVGITWLQAYNNAKAMTYDGLQGYLATLTSIDEQMFIYNSIARNGGWLCGTRARFASAGNPRINDQDSIPITIGSYALTAAIGSDWYWACGPEVGTVFYSSPAYAGVDRTVDGVFNFFSNSITYR